MILSDMGGDEVAIVMKREELLKLQKLVSELWDAEAGDERGLIDYRFLEELYAALVPRKERAR